MNRWTMFYGLLFVAHINFWRVLYDSNWNVAAIFFILACLAFMRAEEARFKKK